jgi:hypothetical protein
MTADVITLPKFLDVLVQRIRSAYERTEHGRREWIEGTLELAAALAEARARVPADRQFSHWIVDAGLEDINHQDRAALISMAADLPATRRVLEETKRLSWRLIWDEEMKAWFTSAGKPDLASQNPEKPAPMPEIEANSVDETAEISAPTKPLTKKSPFFGLLRAEEVAAVYTSIEARGFIGKEIRRRGGKEIWSLILSAIDAGFLSETDIQFSKMTLRVLFPSAPKAFCHRLDLAETKGRQHVRNHIMPAAFANCAAIIASPDQLESIVAAHWQRQQETVRETTAKQKVNDALQAMSANEREVIMFGERLWPRVEHRFGTYDYDQLCAAIWYFRDFDDWLQGSASGKSPRSRAIIIRLSTRWPTEYVDRAIDGESRAKIKKLYQQVHLIARLLEDNPEGECLMPPTPKIEGQW